MNCKKSLTAALIAFSLLGTAPTYAAPAFDGKIEVSIDSSQTGNVSAAERRQKFREALGALRLDANRMVAELLYSSEKKSEQVNLLADKAALISQEGAVLVYQVPLFGDNSLANIIFEGKGFKKPFPAPISQVNPQELSKLREEERTTAGTMKPVVKSKHQDEYSGVIIDCRDIQAEHMLMPVIKNDWGHIVYSTDNFSYKQLCEKPIISYVFGDEPATRAGNKPLVLHGLSFENGAIVLRTEDANRMLALNTMCGFLNKANVVVIMPAN